jgi:hypothetical protein
VVAKGLDGRHQIHPVVAATAVNGGFGHGRRQKCLVTLRVRLDGPKESMTIVVLVPDEDGKDAVREFGIARALRAAIRQPVS